VTARTWARPVVVDDRSPGFTRSGTGWQTSTSGHAGRSLWTSVRAGSVRLAATWRRTLEPGRYGIEVYIPRQNAATQKARYVIATAAGSATRVVDQWQNRGRWVSLGVHDLAATASVRLTDRTGERVPYRIAFDAVRFSRVEP
jgi:hypothetical protein